jgi:hypothetical protein
MIKLAANKTFQKKHKIVDDYLIDLTGNPNEDMANSDNNGNASVDGDAPKRPMGRKKAKQLLRRGGGDACIEAFEQMWAKKKRPMQTKKQRRMTDLTKRWKLKKRSFSYNK